MVDQGPLRIRKQFSSEVLKRHVKREREKKKRRAGRVKKNQETDPHLHSGNMRDQIKRGTYEQRCKVTSGECNDFFTVNNNDGQSEFHNTAIPIIRMASDAQGTVTHR